MSSWTDFFMNPSVGTNTNAGSGNSGPVATDTNGTGTYTRGGGTSGADRYLAASGTPFTSVSTSNGDWVSVFAHGSSTTAFVGQVVFVDPGGTYVDISLTNVIGTRPANGTTYDAKAGGAWLNLVVCSTLMTTGTVPVSTRINMAGNGGLNTSWGTGSSDIVITTQGNATHPIWWRGYNASPGDLDNVADGAANGPQITFTTGRWLFTGQFQILTGLTIASASTGSGTVYFNSGSNQWIDRCRITNTANSALAAAVYAAANFVHVTRSYLKALATTNNYVVVLASSNTLLGNVIIGGATACVNAGGASVIAFNSVNTSSGDCVRVTAGVQTWILCNTFYGASGDGVKTTTTPIFCILAGNIIANSGGYGFENSSGSNSQLIRLCNDFYSNTSGNENATGLADWPAFATQSESVSPFNNAGTDQGLVSTANAKATSIPGKFENQSYTSYLDIGAVQRQEAGGSGVSLARVAGAL